MHTTFPFRIMLYPLLAASLLGCTMGSDFHSATINAPVASFTSEADPGAGKLSSARLDAQWWKLFNDPVLTSLEERALADNADARAAQARIGASRAQLQIAGANVYPSINANASKLRERGSENGLLKLTGTATPASGTIANGADPFGANTLPAGSGPAPYNLYQYGFDASWELDFWGKARRARESAAAMSEAAVYDAQAIRVALAAEVGRTYIQLRGVQHSLRIAREQLEIARASLNLVSRREQQGVATRYEGASSAAQLATVGAAIPELERQRSALMNALALLVNELPHALDAELADTNAIPMPPPSVPVGLPSELARRRPDILKAESELHAATADIGVAKASFYPSISLTGSFGAQSLNFANAGDWGSRQFAFGPVLNLPIFQGGRLTGTLALTETRQQEAAIRFERTVLGAWHEVDDAITAYRSEQVRDEQLATAVSENRVALHSARQRYAKGASGYLNVLIAQNNLLSSEKALTESRAGISVSLVKLYKALGGGWDAPLQASAFGS